MTTIAIKMAAAGYSTHAFGKWDIGMATTDHTPNGRGYNTSLHYYHHDNDYWNMKVGGCDWDGHEWKVEVVDLWQTNLDGPGQGPANLYNNSCTGNLPNVNDDRDRIGLNCYRYGEKADKSYGGYEDALFAQQVLVTVEQHDLARPCEQCLTVCSRQPVANQRQLCSCICTIGDTI